MAMTQHLIGLFHNLDEWVDISVSTSTAEKLLDTLIANGAQIDTVASKAARDYTFPGGTALQSYMNAFDWELTLYTTNPTAEQHNITQVLISRMEDASASMTRQFSHSVDEVRSVIQLLRQRPDLALGVLPKCDR
jgi:hypothetical protein